MIPCHYHYSTIIRYCFSYTNLFTIPINYLLFFAVTSRKTNQFISMILEKMSYASGHSPYYLWKRLIKYKGSQLCNNLPETLKSVQSMNAYRVHLWLARWKAYCRLPIGDNWTFSLAVMAEAKSVEIGIFWTCESLWAQILCRWGRRPQPSTDR